MKTITEDKAEDKMKKYAIITVNYNRPNESVRLIHSLLNVDYFGRTDIDLIISIDNSGSSDVLDAVQSIEWPYGKRIIRTFEERQGLKKHILSCGDFLENYDAVAVLEDDLIVSQGLYSYFDSSVNFYEKDENIAGISLYKILWNQNSELPFEPVNNGYSTYFMQYAMSWGQIWMKQQWFDFKEWYKSNDEQFDPKGFIPQRVCSWKKSWLKYHIKYCIEKNKYFVYPHESLTTCFESVGEHSIISTSLSQVPLLQGIIRKYNFPKLNQGIKYDAFFERVFEESIENIKPEELIVDIYGKKNLDIYNKRYAITSQRLAKKAIKKYGLVLKPHEMNVISNISGDDIILYDLQQNDIVLRRTDETAFRYYFSLYYKHKEVINSALRRLRKKFFRI